MQYAETKPENNFKSLRQSLYSNIYYHKTHYLTIVILLKTEISRKTRNRIRHRLIQS